MTALCVNGCGNPRDVDPQTGTVYLECWSCIIGSVGPVRPAVSPLRARFERVLGPLYDDVQQQEDAADLRWEREMMGEYPRQKPDATTRDREAA